MDRSGKRTAENAVGKIGFLFLPIWEIRRNSLHSYLCEPVLTGENGQQIRGGNLRLRFDSPAKRLELDVEAVRRTCAKLCEAAEHDILVRFTVPVHYSTLASKESASRYMEEFQKTLHWISEIFFEIIETPAAVSLVEVLEMSTALGKSLLLRVTPSFRDMAAAAAHGIHSIGFDLWDDERPEDAIMKDMEAFTSLARTVGIHTHIHGLKTISLSTAAAAAGFDYVESSAIAASLDGYGMDNFMIKPIDIFNACLKGKPRR